MGKLILLPPSLQPHHARPGHVQMEQHRAVQVLAPSPAQRPWPDTKHCRGEGGYAVCLERS